MSAVATALLALFGSWFVLCGADPVLGTPPVFAPSTYYDVFAYLSPFFDISASALNGTIPSAREGAVYADEGEEYLYMAGGVQLTTGQAFADIYVLDTQSGSDTFYRCPSSLPTTLYYSTGDWSEEHESMFVYSGISSSPSASTPTYFNGVYQVDFDAASRASPATCSVTTLTLSPAVTPRQWASSEVFLNSMYVFGGVNLVQNLSVDQVFFSIDLTSGAVTSLSASPSAYFPPSRIDPVLMVDEEMDEIFIYSGMISLGVFDDSHVMYRYDVARNLWLEPVTPLLSGSSSLLSDYPEIVFAGHTHSTNAEHYFFVGGSDGVASVAQMVHIDLSTEETRGVPTISVLYTSLPTGLQHAVVGINDEAEFFVVGGATISRSGAVSYGSAVYEAELPVLGSSSVIDAYSTFKPAQDDTVQWSTAGAPLQREGAAYGNDDDEIYFAGGAVITPSLISPLMDIWAMDSHTEQFHRCQGSLPSPSYFGVGEFVEEQESLYVWGGRTNSEGPGTDNTYNNNLYRIDFTNAGSDKSTPIITNVTLLGKAIHGVEHASSISFNQKMYVFGGVSGRTENVQDSTQQWFVIDLQSYTVSALDTASAHFPSQIWVNPVLFTTSTFQYIYLMGGLDADHKSFNNPFEVEVYDVVNNRWLADIEPVISPYSSLPNQLPNFVFAAHAHSMDHNHVILVGGSEGSRGPNVPGSHNKIVHIDCTPLITTPTTGSPIISVLPSRLVYAVESAVVGLVEEDTELIIFSGAQYSDSLTEYPIKYVSAVQEVDQIGVDHSVAFLSSSSSSSLSKGQITGIVIGVVIATALLLVLFLYFIARCKRSGLFHAARRYNTQSDDLAQGRAEQNEQRDVELEDHNV